MPSSSLGDVVERIFACRRSLPADRSVLVAVTGIDGCGKGWVTSRLLEALAAIGIRAVGISVDGWLHLPDRRFHDTQPAQHFYLHAVRFDEMFERLILPLRDRRSVTVEADFTEETATRYRRHVYDVQDADVVLLEGIYLLKREHRGHFDLSVWVECSFETALERAIARAQEGLSREETVREYERIYFPAQELHFRKDRPREAATVVLVNDPRLQPDARAG
ncbi:MAG: uridine kinase [Candidatus Eiseniibacteriota bacterium]